MKNRNLIFPILFLMICNVSFSQNLKNNSIFGRNTQQTESHSKIANSQNSCNTIFSFDCRNIPTGLAWDGQNFWCADTGYIYKISPSGVYLDSIINPAETVFFLKGGDLTYDGSNLWYADEQSATLFKINPSTGSVSQSFNLPSYGQFDPNGFSIAWDGTNLWHTWYNDTPKLFKLSPVDGSILDSLPTNRELLTLEWVKGALYGMGEDKLYKLNTSTGMVEDSVDWCVPFSLGLVWDGKAYWNVSGATEIFGIPTGGENKVFKMNADVNLAIDEFLNRNEITVFPNPAATTVSIKGYNLRSIEIYDVTGSLVYSQNNIHSNDSEINISNLPKGLYVAKVYQGNDISTQRLVVQ